MTPEERQAMEREAERIRTFRGKPITLRCACGNDFETDMEVARAQAQPCSRCGKTEWKLLQARTIVKDKSAPTELIEAQEKEKDNGDR